MNVLLVGVGVVGTVYGTRLVASGHNVDVLAHGPRTQQVQRSGLLATDTVTGVTTESPVTVIATTSGRSYDLVVISVRADQIRSACADLQLLAHAGELLFLGNNPAGHAGIPGGLPGPRSLGFPGVGGQLVGDRVEYMRIPGQPTTLEKGGGPNTEAFAATLASSGFALTETSEFDGWLMYHAVFLGSISAALGRCGGSAAALAADRRQLTLMCRSIEEGFRAVGKQGVRGLPRNLRMLHQPAWRSFAVWYWARTMQSPMGEQCFAAHCRHAGPEMQLLVNDILGRTAGASHTEHLRLLLAASGDCHEGPRPSQLQSRRQQ